MSFRRQLGVSFAIQGAGAASLLLATVWLGAAEGPVVQGGFNRLKSEVEFVAAVALFGLPQALFYFVKSAGIGLHVALRWVLACICLAAPIAGAFVSMRGGSDGLASALFVVTVMALVGHGLLRSLLLIDMQPAWFSMVTAAPQVLMLAGIGTAIAMNLPTASPTWLVILLTAFASISLVALRRLSKARPKAPDREARQWRGLVHYSLATWIVSMLSTAAIVFMQHWVLDREGPAALGRFTLASTLAQVPLTPIAYAAPLLLRRWMDQPGARASRRLGALVFVALLTASGLVGAMAIWVPGLGLGESYRGSMPALAVLLLGAAAEAASRVLTIQAGATGMPWLAVRSEAARWIVLSLTWCSGLPEGLLPLCWAWAAAAFASAAVFALQSRSFRPQLPSR